MFLGIALVVSIISVIGCIKIKKPVARIVLGILGTVSLLIVILVGSLTYITSYKVNNVDSSVSSDGKFELLFQQIGDPDFPFGYTHTRLVLKEGSETIAKYSFDVANDGGNVSSKSWQVTWRENCVEAVISGEEQNDIQYILYFDGKTDFNQLDSKYEKKRIEPSENIKKLN